MYLTPSQPPPTYVAGQSSGVAPPKSSLNPAPMWEPLPTTGTFTINGRQFGNDPGATWAELGARAYIGENDVQQTGTGRGQIETKVRPNGATPLTGIANGSGDTGAVYRIQPAPVDSRVGFRGPQGKGVSGVSAAVEWGVHFDTTRLQTGEAPPGRPPLGPQRDQLSIQYPRVEVLGGRDRNPGQMGLRYDLPRAPVKGGAPTMGAGTPLSTPVNRPGTDLPQRSSMVPQSYTGLRYPVAETEPLSTNLRKEGGKDRGWRAPPKTFLPAGAPAAERGDVTQPQSRQIELDKLLIAMKLPKPMTVFQETRTLEDTSLVTSDRKNRYPVRVR